PRSRTSSACAAGTWAAVRPRPPSWPRRPPSRSSSTATKPSSRAATPRLSMEPNRRTRDRTRRAILCADLDRLTHARPLWQDSGDRSARADERRDAVRAAVATALTDKQRQVVEAYFFEGLSQGEIARRLGVTQQVVQKRLYGAPRGGRIVGGAIP